MPWDYASGHVGGNGGVDLVTSERFPAGKDIALDGYRFAWLHIGEA